MPDSRDEEQLLAELRESLQARQAVPLAFIEAARNAYAWHNIDSELAQLTYDSSHEQDRTPSMRSETAAIRALTFTSPHLVIELEVGEDSLIGQIIPPQEGTIETRTRTGATAAARIDKLGCFSIDPIPASPFRLHCRTGDGTDVLTGWITV